MKTERELFEDAMQELSGGQTKNDANPVTGEYQYGVMEVMWKVWQASASREGYKLVPVDTLKEALSWADETYNNCWDHKQFAVIEKHADVIKKAMIGAVD